MTGFSGECEHFEAGIVRKGQGRIMKRMDRVRSWKMYSECQGGRVETWKRSIKGGRPVGGERRFNPGEVPGGGWSPGCGYGCGGGRGSGKREDVEGDSRKEEMSRIGRWMMANQLFTDRSS